MKLVSALRERLNRPVVLASAAALIVGLVGGVGLGVALRPDPTTTEEYVSLSKSRDNLNGTVEQLTSKLRSANDDLAVARQDARIATDAADARSKELDEREASLAGREAQVSSAEQQKAANSFGNGVKIVGQNVAAGTYSTEGGTASIGCYYSWKTGTGSDADIVDNNIVDGSATVTLVDGEIFEAKGCKTWTKVS